MFSPCVQILVKIQGQLLIYVCNVYLYALKNIKAIHKVSDALAVDEFVNTVSTLIVIVIFVQYNLSLQQLTNTNSPMATLKYCLNRSNRHPGQGIA